MRDINSGDRLFHYNPNTKKITGCTVEVVVDKNIIIELDKANVGNVKLKLPLKCFGEWLFYEENHIGLDLDELAKMEEYYRFGNSKIENVLSERKNFERALADRRINNLVHFTRLENLRSILEYGLVSRNKQDSLNIKSVCNDIERFDYRLDATSCSVTFPNDKIFRRFREAFPNNKWAIVVIDAEIILSKEVVCEFCLTNAANRIMRSKSGFKFQHFQNMFSNEVIIEKLDGSSYTCVRQQMPDNFTTDVQAEILISGNIGKQYIKKVSFDTLATKNKWYTENIDIASGFSLDVVPEYFDWRK